MKTSILVTALSCFLLNLFAAAGLSYFNEAESQKKNGEEYFIVRGKVIHEDRTPVKGLVVYASSHVEDGCVAFLKDPETDKWFLPPNDQTDDTGIFEIKVKRSMLRSNWLCFFCKYPNPMMTPSNLTDPAGIDITIKLEGDEELIDLEKLMGGIVVHIR